MKSSPENSPALSGAAAASVSNVRRKRPPLKARIADFAWRKAKALTMAYLKWKDRK